MKNQEAFSLLKETILARTTNEITDWIEQVLSMLNKQVDTGVLSHNIAMVPKKIGKDCFLEPEKASLPKFSKLCPGWQPEKWLLTESVRILFNLSIAQRHHDSENIFAKIHRMTELSEKGAYLKGLFLYNRSNYHQAQALEAIRSNTQSLFAAVCLFNPYPAENFMEGEWNNMILKALTWNFALDHIYGFDNRKNTALSTAIYEYIRELRSANRDIPLDLWRCVDPLTDHDALLEQ
ncbi:MAG: EboA domain-containing protein [Nitrosomonas sp.]|nr:EboA domain-containing protein [Nitrosomonas sp.]